MANAGRECSERVNGNRLTAEGRTRRWIQFSMADEKVSHTIEQIEQTAKGEPFTPLLCSNCFDVEGLRLGATLIGLNNEDACPNCGALRGAKLDALRLEHLVKTYFTEGTLQKPDYGGYPALVSNKHQKTSVKLAGWAGRDIELISEKSGIGIFFYGPRFWMFGEVEPLKALISGDKHLIIERILSEYPTKYVPAGTRFYRMRRNPLDPASSSEYDSPPDQFCGSGRLDSAGFPVLYASQDLQICVHECRTTVDDETFFATLIPVRELKLLDLTHLLREENITEFESLDLAVHMLFLAKSHSYSISREIARSVKKAGFDGIVYPSYFSLVSSGARPFETVYGISIRRIPELIQYASSQTIANVAIFGRPLKDGLLEVKSINRVVMSQAAYQLTFGPVGFGSK